MFGAGDPRGAGRSYHSRISLSAHIAIGSDVEGEPLEGPAVAGDPEAVHGLGEREEEGRNGQPKTTVGRIMIFHTHGLIGLRRAWEAGVE